MHNAVAVPEAVDMLADTVLSPKLFPWEIDAQAAFLYAQAAVFGEFELLLQREHDVGEDPARSGDSDPFSENGIKS